MLRRIHIGAAVVLGGMLSFPSTALGQGEEIVLRVPVTGVIDLGLAPFIERAIRDVEKQAGGLNEIKRSAETIQSGSQRILDRVRKMQKNLEEAVAVLDECTEEARRALGED